MEAGEEGRVEEVSATTRKRKLSVDSKDKEQKEQTNVKRSKDCFRCGGYGHLKLECISAVGAIDIDNKFACFKCSGKGHYARDCPNLRGDMCFVCGLLGHHGLDCPSNIKRKGPPSRVRIDRVPVPAFYGAPYPPRYTPDYSSMMGSDLAWGGGVDLGIEKAIGVAAGTGFPVVDMKYRTVDGGIVGCFRCGDTRHLARECHTSATTSAVTVADEATTTTTLQFPLGFVGVPAVPIRGGFRLPENCFRCGGVGHFFRECKLVSDDAPTRDGCFKCGQSGHLSKNCSGPDKRVCFVCHKLGHVAKECNIALSASVPTQFIGNSLVERGPSGL